MTSPQKNHIAQIVLLTILGLLIYVDFSDESHSQTCIIPRYSHQPIHVTAWLPAMQVIVKIDSQFSQSKATGIAQGNGTWNHPLLLNCSGVTFNDFDPIFIPDENLEDTPPRGHLIWQEDDPLTGANGGVFLELGFAGFVEAARIKIKPNLSNISGYFNYLGTHEVGHTFNLNDCVSTTGCPTWTDATIMTGHADGITTPASFNTTGPKTCDIAKVRDIYCPAPSPTPTSSPTPEPVIPTEPEPCQAAVGSGTLQVRLVIRTPRILDARVIAYRICH